MCTDQGGEYPSEAFISHLNEYGTHHELTVHDSPQQDGKAALHSVPIYDRYEENILT